MARRRKPDLADALMELVALLPWWAGVALAVAAYLILHAIAAQPVAAIANPSQMQGAATAMLSLKPITTAGVARKLPEMPSPICP